MTGEATSESGPIRLGSYELVRPLAQGGMASVYLARRLDVDSHVAVKLLSRTHADADARSMFLEEARIATLLDHENIARVFDIDITSDGQHYLAMEYVHGADLRELLSAAAHANRPLPYETTIAIIMAAATGLDHAHNRCDPHGKPLRIVHRDVSLSNIMVGYDGVVKVVDFGIATTALRTIQTLPGVVRGKASYMAPEQCLGDRVDRRADVFALGIVLYELATGARCFSGSNDFDRMLSVVRGDYVSPHDVVAKFPSELGHVIRCALATDPSRRFPSAAALADALGCVLSDRGWTGGGAAIAHAMAVLFGEVPEPRSIALASSSTTERHFIQTPFAGPTVPSLRLARGTEPPVVIDDDEQTRGRRPLRRPPRLALV